MKSKKGIAIKLANKVSKLARDIINEHFLVEKEEGKVFFSTDIPINSLREIEIIIFQVEYNKELIYVAADVINVMVQKDPFIPPYVEKKLIPESYKNEPKRSWLLITNMQKVDKKFLDKCSVYYTDGRKEKVTDVLSTPRVNRAYFTWENNAIEDNLLI